MWLHKNNRNRLWHLYALGGIIDGITQLLTFGYFSTDLESIVYMKSLGDGSYDVPSVNIIHMDDEEPEID